MADAPTVNGLRTVSVRLLHLWRGAWICDAEIDPDDVAQAPSSGPVTLLMGGSTLLGTVDPRGSGTFVSRAWVRIVGGANGWDQPIAAQHFHADNQTTNTAVYSAAASLVGEKVVVAKPAPLAVDFVRSAGPASRVLEDVDWYVDLQGVTQVGPRLPAVPDLSLTLIDWDPVRQLAELTCDALVVPGTVVTDPRLNGQPITLRDVEQIFDAQGSRITAWVSTSPATRLLTALSNAIRELAGTAYLKVRRYRIIQENVDGRLQLQAVAPSQGMPDTLPLRVWPGMSGDSAKLKPSSEVLVHFVDGLPEGPVVLGFSSEALPLERTVDATVATHIGPSSPLVDLAGGKIPIALATPLTTFLTALQTWTEAVATALNSAGFPIAAPQTALEAAIAAAKSSTPSTKVQAV